MTAKYRNTDRQFRAADAAVTRAVGSFIGKIESMCGRWDAVYYSTILECMLVELCGELSKLTDEPALRNHAGPATIKLANALADYRDSDPGDR